MKTYAVYQTNVCRCDCCYEENKNHVDEESREILIDLTPKNLEYLKSSNWHINHDDNNELGTDIKEYEDIYYLYNFPIFKKERRNNE